ncbi:MAG: PH domain-containing protein [Solirubrobacterales bacterium]|nr:PH domain-containing protein [Solirubrobacterales bacterium]
MDLHTGEQIVFQGHPSWRAAPSFYLKGILPVLVVAVILFFAVSTAAGILAVVIGTALVVVVGIVKRAATDYVITTERLHIRRGLLSKHVQQTSIDRVQNVNTNQSVLERVLRVGHVDFDTAGTDDSDFTFRGIAHPDQIVAAVDRAQRTQRAAPAGGPQPL